MRIISLLITLLIIGFLINQQMSSKSSSQRSIDDFFDAQGISAPKTPTSPEEVKIFEKEINKFMQDSALERAKELEDATAR